MARRSGPPRKPAQSATPRHETTQQSKAQIAGQSRWSAIDFLSDPECPRPVFSNETGHDENDEKDSDADDDSEDIDIPRVAQWIDDDFELNEQSDDVSENDDDDDAEPSQRLQSLQDDLSTLPLGALRNAQRSLTQTQTPSDSEPDSIESSKGDFSASDEEDDPSPHPVKGNDKDKPKDGLTKRSNKHAPTEVTSKRSVSRRRIVVIDKLPKPRDPRFMHAAGRYDPSKFKQQYDFLSGLHSNELVTIREHVKRARKLLANCPLGLRADREQELQRLERAMKKTESAVNQDNRERVEREALQSAKQAEEEKRKKGKSGWWMKRSEKKELLAKARLDAIASAGGKQAVKKALEKKQRRISQKEKRTRPFPRSEGTDFSNGKRRRPAGSIDLARMAKRRKVV